MSAAVQASKPFVPPYPARPEKPLGALSTILTLRRNPLEIWGKADFERPFSIGRTILGVRAAAHDPAAVRRVFLDNAANYRKDDLQLKVLSPGLGDGLSDGRGRVWRLQRRSLAPLFSPRLVSEFAPAMQRVAEATVERLSHRHDGAVTDVGELMSRMALEVLEQTLFSQGLGREASAFQRAVTSYFDSFGGWIPSISLARRLPAAVWTTARAAGAQVLQRGCRRHHREAQGAARPGRRGAPRSSDPAAGHKIRKPASVCPTPASAPISSRSSWPVTRRRRTD